MSDNINDKKHKLVDRLLQFDFNREQELKDIIVLAAELCNTPVALLTLLDEDTQWIKIKIGIDVDQTPRAISFCTHAVEQDQVFVIPDALEDERFVKNPLVTNDPNIRFYAGAPLRSRDGNNIGTLCVIDKEPKELNDKQKKILDLLSKQVMNILELELSVELLKNTVDQLQGQKNKLRSFFESSLYGHLLLSKDMRVMAYNKVLADFLKDMRGVDIKEGEDMLKYITPSFKDGFESNCKKALNGEHILMEQKVDYGAKGSIWWKMSFEPAYSKTGEMLGISFNSTDITNRKNYEEKVLNQNEILKKVAHIQSHEFRGPVASILGILDVIEQEGEGDNRKYYKMIKSAAKDLDSKIHDINNTIPYNEE